MGRRGALNMKVVLPSVSWLAVMRLLKKAPKSLPSTGMGVEMVMKAMIGCRALPETESSRYADNYLAKIKGWRGGGCGGGRRPKPAMTLLPMMSKISSCTSRPHTDSFRVHHVVNQEALQLMLALDGDHDAFFEPYDDDMDDDGDDEVLCYGGILRDGDRLFRDEQYDVSARAMSRCSSRLSGSTPGTSSSWSVLTAPSALSRSSVDSEGHYSTTTSATCCFHTPAAELGPHIMRSTCASSPSSSTASSCCLHSSDKFSAVDLLSDGDSDRNLNTSKSEAREVDVDYPKNVNWIEVQEKRDNRTRHDLLYPTTGAVDEYIVNDDLRHPATTVAGGPDAGAYVDEDAGLEYEGDADGEGYMVTEVRYSEDPLVDFAESIGQMVIWQQLNQPAQLHNLYCRYLRLNSPAIHPTIALAFVHALQHLSNTLCAAL